MKVIIAGGRYFKDYQSLHKFCEDLLQNEKNIEIVSGGAKGADFLGEKYAKAKNHRIIRFPAAWKKYGKRAGIIRNLEMAEYADLLIAFWDGKSKGTASIIRFAKNKGLQVYVYDY